MTTTKLMPVYSSQKSFNNKALVENRADGSKTLHSYRIAVARVENGEAKVFDTYSQTTLKHIKEFLLQNGFKADNKKQILTDYGVK